MKLPSDYQWIPGFEERYAVKIINGNIVRTVYSFVCPGYIGEPYLMTPKWDGLNDRTFSLTKDGKKVDYAFSYLERLVEEKDRGNQVNPSLLKPMKNEKCWIICWRVDDNLVFSRDPDRYPSLSSAEEAAYSVARANPGCEYFVVETVRKVVSGGVVSTAL